jgi:hypothetical protein
LNEPLQLDRLRAAFAAPGEAPSPGTAACPTDEAIWDAVHGALPPHRLREIVDHLAACPACAESWRIAMMFERADTEAAAAGEAASTPAAAAPLPPAGTGRRARLWRYGGAAAAAALAAAVLLHQGAGQRVVPGGTTLRGGGTTGERVTGVHWLTAGEAVLLRTDAVIRWAGPSGSIYDLMVERDEAPAVPATPSVGAAGPLPPLVEASGLTATLYRLPPADLAPLPAAGLVRATLTAHLPDGRSVTIFRDFRVR